MAGLRYGQRTHVLLDALQRPRSNRELAELVEDHGGAVARDMAKFRERGWATNLNPGKGLLASYVLTAAGHTKLLTLSRTKANRRGGADV